MAKLILVLGTQGAGKTTVLEGVKSAKTVSMGTELFNALAKEYGTNNRDVLRKKQLLAYDRTVETRKEVLEKLGGLSGTIAVDTHPAIKTGDAYMPGLSFEDFEAMKGKAKAILYIDSENEQIIKRRQSDKTRKREVDTLEELDIHRNINMIFSILSSLYLQIPIYYVKNRHGKLEETQRRVEEIIKSIK